jgi:hypothetical protein
VTTSAEPIRPRPFRIADGMVLIAGLFVAAAWDRARVLGAFFFPFRLGDVFRSPSPAWVLAHEAAVTVLLWLPFLVVGSLTVFALRWLRPRPEWRELCQQPGAAACALASLAIIPIGGIILATHAFSGRPLAIAWARVMDDARPENLTVVASLIGLAVLVAWIVMRSTHQWKPEASWIDRFGRLLGWGWILMIAGGMIELVLSLVRLASG